METILNMVKQDVRGFRQQSKLLADVRLSSGGPSFLLQHINNASIEGFCIKPVTVSDVILAVPYFKTQERSDDQISRSGSLSRGMEIPSLDEIKKDVHAYFTIRHFEKNHSIQCTVEVDPRHEKGYWFDKGYNPTSI